LSFWFWGIFGCYFTGDSQGHSTYSILNFFGVCIHMSHVRFSATQVMMHQLSISSRLVHIWACMGPIVLVAGASDSEGHGILAERVSAQSKALEAVVALEAYMASLFRAYEDANPLQLPGKLADHKDFEVNCGMAILHPAQTDHSDFLDAAPYAHMVQLTLTSGVALLNFVKGVWVEDLEKLCALIKKSIPVWEPHAETLFLEEGEETCKAVLGNKAYPQLASMSSLATKMIMAERLGVGSIFSKELVKEALRLSALATITVSVTFVAFHVKVSWPRLQGIKHQAQARDELIKSLQPESGKGTWGSLSQHIRDTVEAFGTVTKPAVA
jgi:hypothetical protein